MGFVFRVWILGFMGMPEHVLPVIPIKSLEGHKATLVWGQGLGYRDSGDGVLWSTRFKVCRIACVWHKGFRV